MVISVLKRFATASAVGTMVLRAGIVAVNLAVMIGLAALLGLGAFGELAVIWGASLVAAMALSLGGPLMLLRRLTDGGGVRRQAVIAQVMVLPVVLAFGAFIMLDTIFPTLPWLAILCAGLGINLITSLASIMRALGSVQASMAIKDAGPQVALALAALTTLGSQGPVILLHSVIWLGLISALAGIWCLRHVRWDAVFKPNGARGGIAWSLWGTSVLGMALAQVDIIIGGSILPPEQIGLYVVLRRLANLVALPVSVATWVSAGPVSAAYGAHDTAQLHNASKSGSQIAFIPGVILFCLALASLPLLHLVIGQTLGQEGRWVLITLLFGALIQVVFASSFTVATLCGYAHLAATSRLISIVIYLAAVWAIGPALISSIANAVVYAGATALGSLLLWYQIRRELQLDTSAYVLWRQMEAAWKPS